MSRRSVVLQALKAAGRDGVSGQALARDLGVSRVAVAKHIAALKAAGYDIEAVAGLGYRLVASPDLPLPDEIEPLLTSTLWTCVGGGATGSTNDDAKALARGGATEGTVVMASAQSSGRGRLGRAWESPSGGLYMSCVLRPSMPVSEVPPLALVVAMGVAEGLRAIGVDAMLKWPNDVMCAGGKLAGVLLETSAETDRVDWVVAGCGINVRRDGDGVDGAAYLEEVLGRDLRLAEVASRCLDGIAEGYDAFVSSGFPAMREEYEERLMLVGERVTVRDPEGDVLGEGEVSGVDEGGRLVVSTAEGEVSFASGAVTLKG